MALVDGSENSKKALLEAMAIIDKDKDSVECLTIGTDPSAQAIPEMCQKIFASFGYTHGKCTLIPREGSSVPDAISSYLTKDSTPDYDFIVLGSRGSSAYKRADAHYLGSVAEKVIIIARTNMLLVVK